MCGLFADGPFRLADSRSSSRVGFPRRMNILRHSSRGERRGRPMRRRVLKHGLVLPLALAASALVGIVPAFAGTAKTIVVHPGQLIQKAVNDAAPGDTI